MKHKGTKTIETDRLILRKFNLSDADYVFNNWASDDEVTKFLRWPSHQNIELTRDILFNWIKEYEKDNYYQWAIVLKEIDEPIGSIGVVEMDEECNMVHIGYCIGRKWWRMGITSEALAALIEYFFEEIEVLRIESMHDPNNPNSGKVMKKCGMRYERTVIGSDWNNQGICDASYYAILRNEYKK